MSTRGSCYEKHGKDTFKLIVLFSVLLEIIALPQCVAQHQN
jgi:hypothetical protein